MKTLGNHFYRDGAIHHLYLKALKGNVIFYRVEDYILYFTLFCVLAMRYRISVYAFCIMFNHTHSSVKAPDRDLFLSFCRDLQSIFARDFNEEYGRKGPLMMKCGYAPKQSPKAIRTNFIYIENNPVAGRLVVKALEYKWNLLAYYRNSNPFSKKLVKRNCRFRMRRALKLIDECRKNKDYINYRTSERIFQGLTREESLQIVDYIITSYNVLDYDKFFSAFGGYEKAIITIDSTTGREDEIVEEWEDYSIYRKILSSMMKRKIYDLDFGFDAMSRNDLNRLLKSIDSNSFSHKHIKRFFHIG